MNPAPIPDASTNWSSRQVFLQAAICLILGIMLGFFIRGSRSAAATRAPAASVQPASGALPGMPPVTPEQLKHMADKQAQPLLMQLQSTPNDPELLAKLGYVYYATRNFKEASEYYKRSVDIRDDTAVRTELGRSYYYAGEPELALTTFQNVLKIDPDNANAMYNIGLIKWQDRFDADGAVAVWKRMLKKNPNHPRRAEVEQLIARARQHSALKNPERNSQRSR